MRPTSSRTPPRASIPRPTSRSTASPRPPGHVARPAHRGAARARRRRRRRRALACRAGAAARGGAARRGGGGRARGDRAAERGRRGATPRAQARGGAGTRARARAGVRGARAGRTRSPRPSASLQRHVASSPRCASELRTARRVRRAPDQDRALGAATERAARARTCAAPISPTPLPVTAPLAEGDPVEPDLGVRGTIASIRSDQAEVIGAAGQRVSIPLEHLRPSRERAPEERTPVVQVRAAARGDVSDQLDVRGLPGARGARAGAAARRRSGARRPQVGARRARPRHRRAAQGGARGAGAATRSSRAASPTPRTARRSRTSASRCAASASPRRAPGRRSCRPR